MPFSDFPTGFLSSPEMSKMTVREGMYPKLER